MNRLTWPFEKSICSKIIYMVFTKRGWDINTFAEYVEKYRINIQFSILKEYKPFKFKAFIIYFYLNEVNFFYK